MKHKPKKIKLQKMSAKQIILYAGQPRLILENINSIKSSVNTENNHYIFALWDNNESKKVIKELKKHLKNYDSILIKPRSYLWEKITTNLSGFHGDDFKKVLYQYDALQQAMNFAETKLSTNEDHQLWCRSRTDLFIDKIKLKEKYSNFLVVPGSKFGIGYTDYFAISNKNNMRVYCDLIDTILDLLKLNIFLTSEIVLAIHLNKMQIPVIIDKDLPQILLKKKKNKLLRRNNYRSEYKPKLVNHPAQYPIKGIEINKNKFNWFNNLILALYRDIKFQLKILLINNNKTLKD